MNKVKKIAFAAGAAAIILGSVAGSAFAAAPTNPGCFGNDRAAYAEANGSLGADAGGVGYYAAQRAGDNGSINMAYMEGCGGTPQ